MMGSLRARGGELLRLLARRRAPVDFAGLSQLEPASRKFGFDRGTPIDRYYIERFLGARANLLQGRSLEVGDDAYTRRFGDARVRQRDILHVTAGHPGATLIADLAEPSTLPMGMFDCFLCTQTLNFLFDVPRAVEGAHRLLKPGGVWLLTVAGVSQVSRHDQERWGAFWGFTEDSIRRLLEPAFGEEFEVQTFGNLVAAIALLQGLAVEDLPDPSLLDRLDPDYPVLIGATARKAL
jgi:SAM-dependent methyltransferase